MVDLKKGTTGTEVVDLCFRYQHRLHTAAAFSTVFSVRRVFRGAVFDLHYCSRNPGEGSEPGTARLGLVIAKKLAHRAVQRNLLKRLARESFRLARQTLPPYDLVLRLAKMPGRSLDSAARRAWRIDIEHLLGRLQR